MDAKKLKALNITEYNLIANKNPGGSYDRKTREYLCAIITKLRKNEDRLSRLETKLYRKFKNAQFTPLDEKGKKVRLEVARYQLSSGVKSFLKLFATFAGVVTLTGLVVYQAVLDDASRRKVDVAFNEELSRFGLIPEEKVAQIKTDLAVTEKSLEKTRKDFEELAQLVDRMIQNNKVQENLKYILKRIYNNPRTKYIQRNDRRELIFNGKRIARYDARPEKWYLLGIIDSGVIRVYYDNDEILEVEAIFGRKGEETPPGEYEIKNKLHKPTWYKKEEIGGQMRVRAIPFGDPDHEIGYWWLGLRKLGEPVPGSYGIHGVNASKTNEFFKKKYDWRSGSAGCPNIQEWYLEFLARMVPVGTRVNIVQRDKWKPGTGPQKGAA